MPLLGIGKKQETKEAQTSEVPDELPDLPQDSSSAADAPDELPPVDEPLPGQDLAPDELPPVDEPTALGASGDDKKLYFSSLLQKLHEEGLKSTKLTAPSANLLSDMKKHWKDQKAAAERDAMLQEVAQSIDPLQRLEQEWVALQEDIENKKRLLQEKEEQIRQLADKAKSAALKAQKKGVPG
ncbi:hypothetical protein KY363_03460 [Candidatus Woesearchaeota archaeon]|nr:hypothetical protein [Candidatus Woesearchaeota archaeon]